VKELTCILCPNGCGLHIEETAEGLSITGNLCGRGIGFAEAEITNPIRTVTTTVRTIFPEAPVLPVRTDGEIPRGKIRDLMKTVNSITVTEPLGIGEAVLKDALGLGVSIITTSNILREREV
jgi:CxxC motif-containing protein